MGLILSLLGLKSAGTQRVYLPSSMRNVAPPAPAPANYTSGGMVEGAQTSVTTVNGEKVLTTELPAVSVADSEKDEMSVMMEEIAKLQEKYAGMPPTCFNEMDKSYELMQNVLTRRPNFKFDEIPNIDSVVATLQSKSDCMTEWRSGPGSGKPDSELKTYLLGRYPVMFDKTRAKTQ